VTSRTIAIDAIELHAAELSLRVGVASIRQILPAIGLMRVPLSRTQVAGVVAHDGRAIPVYRLESLAETLMATSSEEGPSSIQLPESAGGRTRREVFGHPVRHEPKLIVIVEHDGALAGILVESTRAVRTGADPSAHIFDARTLLTTAGILEGDTGQPAAQTAQGDA